MTALEAQALAKTAWALAKLRCGDRPLLLAIASAARAPISEFRPQNLSLTAWSLSALRLPHEPLLQAIAAASRTKIADFRAQELANTAWAFARCKVAHQPLLQSLSAAAIPKLRQFRPQELANTAWSCAICAFRSREPLAEAIAEAAMPNLSQYAPKDLANIAWSFETMPFAHVPLLQSIAAASMARLADFNAQDLANTAWAFASRALRDGPLLDAIASQSMPPIEYFCPPELASTAWSFSALPVRHEPLLHSISSASRRKMARGGFDQHSLASIAWSCAALPYRHSPLRDAIAAASMRTILQANAQDLANTAWSVATLEFLDLPLLDAIASAARTKLSEFEVREIEMTVWALSQLDDLSSAWKLGEAADACGRLGGLGFGSLQSECVLRGHLEEEIRLLRFAAVSQLGLGPAGPGVAAYAAASSLAAAGEAPGALAALREALPLDVAGPVALACGGGVGGPLGSPNSAALATSPPAGGGEPARRQPGSAGAEPAGAKAGSKAAVLLPCVLRRAAAGDPGSVCAAFEECSRELLQPARQWFKIAGGRKADVITSALETAPARGGVLEIGTYLGYSAIRLAMCQPGRRVVTLEVDPGHGLAARCAVAHAGLAHRVDVWTGHSKDLLRRLPAQYPPGLTFAAVFMDQCGSRFWADLEAIVRLGLLQPGAVVVADNVLKPGAPLFLWRAFSAGCLRARVVSVPEFAMPGVEDWVAVAEYTPPAEAGAPLSAAAPVPPAVLELEWEAQQMRARAAGRGSVDFRDWAAFSAWMRGRLAELGIHPDAER